MYEKNHTRSLFAGIAGKLRRAMPANTIVIGLLWLQQPAMAQVVRDYRVTSLKPFQFEWISDWRPLKQTDTVKLLTSGKVHVVELRCKTASYADYRRLKKLSLSVGDTLQTIKQL